MVDVNPYAIVTLFASGLIGLIGMTFARYRQAQRLAAEARLSARDRLHIVFAMQHLENAERELAQAAWVGHQPGHPFAGSLLLEIRNINSRARQALRNEA
jgi:hypothetical protein